MPELEPSRSRLEDARRRGDLPISLNLAATAAVGSALLSLPSWGVQLVEIWSSHTTALLHDLANPDLDQARLLVEDIATLLFPLLILVVVSFVLVAALQTRFNLTLSPLARPRLNGLPTSRLILERLVQLLTATVVLLVLVCCIATLLPTLPTTLGAPQNVTWGVRQIRTAMLMATGAASVTIVLELWLRRRLHRRALSMTPAEQRREAREQQTPEQLRRAQLRSRNLLAQQRSFAPAEHTHRLWDHATHRAVDLVWEPGSGLLFLAHKSETPPAPRPELCVLEAPELARSLYRADVGFPVPERLWDDCAEILSAVAPGR